MRKNHLAIKLFSMAGISALLFSCNGDTKETTKTDSEKTADTTATMQAAPTPTMEHSLTAPFDVAVMTHAVKDYAAWRPVFNADSTSQKASGMETLVVATEMDKPNNVYMAFKISDVAKAKAMVADPKLKETMGKAGVTSKPEVEYLHVIRFNSESKEKKWVTIAHKVKDFDAWVKVYDSEGTAKRASEGMVDVVLGRGIDDPNLVYIVFDITDMAKAKAALASEEKKKLMASAGVEGMPKIAFYNTAE